MSTPEPTGGSRELDALIALGALCVVSACVVALTRPTQHRSVLEESVTPRIGALHFSYSEVRRRPAGTLVWFPVEPGEAVFEEDAIFVPPNGSASFALDDGSTLEIEERSLVVLERRDVQGAAPLRVALQKGSVAGSAGAGGLEIRARGGVTASLPREAEARVAAVDGSAEVEVLRGEATLRAAQRTERLSERQGATMAAAGLRERHESTVTLEAPARNARLFVTGSGAPVELRWRELGAVADLRVQVAAERGFSVPVVAVEAHGGSAAVTLPGQGVYWWRVVDAAGEVRSEARKLTLVAEVAPQPLSPRADERFEGETIVFAWTAVRGAARYRLEVASDGAFQHPVATTEVTGTQHRWRTALTDGTYYWRVRASDTARPGAPVSEPIRFVRSEKPLPAAPQLLNPVIEVDRGDHPGP